MVQSQSSVIDLSADDDVVEVTEPFTTLHSAVTALCADRSLLMPRPLAERVVGFLLTPSSAPLDKGTCRAIATAARACVARSSAVIPSSRKVQIPAPLCLRGCPTAPLAVLATVRKQTSWTVFCSLR